MSVKTVGFELEEERWARLKTIAISQKKTVRQTLTQLIEDYISMADREELIDKIRKIPPEERLTLIHEIKKEEGE